MKVSDIKKLNFCSLSLEEKLEIKNNARPVPNLNFSQVQKKCKGKGEFTRRFNRKVFERTPWICGCEESNSLFCFVCLLFGGDDSWTRDGVSDLKHLILKINKHENSKKHKNNFISFQLLGKTNISASLSTAYAENIRKHNESVEKNRQILSKVIDILKFCGNCNLPLRGHNEKEGSSNKGVFLELVDYTRKIDAAFNSHMEEAHVFKGTSKTVQNELLQYMLDVCREHIIKEIKKTSFLSLMADDTTDVSAKTQTVLVFRYELNGRIHERFWGFSNPEKQDADGLSQCILQQVDPILENNSDKLIAQTYDGAAVMRGREGGVNVKIKEKYKNAHYVYCYAHQLNKLLEQAASNITSVRIFFANLNGIAAFFSHSPDRRAALEHVCDKKIPRPSKTRWNFQSRIIQTVFTYKDDILECFENVQTGVPKIYNSETVTLAAGFVNWLENSTFLFWLNFYSKIMPHVDILFNQLQVLQTDAVRIHAAIDDFEKAIIEIRNKLPSVIDRQEERIEMLAEGPTPRKRRRLNDENLNLSAKEVCDTIVFQIKDRFVFKNHLCGAKIFQYERLNEHKKNGLPVDDINQFCSAFPMIDKNSFMTELEVFYSRSEITEENMAGCLKTLNFITSFGLDGTFKEITKALKILLTIPMTTSESERCFSTLKLIKSYLRNTMSEDRLTALAMLSIEQLMIREIPDFNELVIEKFISDKNRRLDFSFKR